MRDRVGLGWRPAIADRIFAAGNRLDVVEVIAEDWMNRPAREVRALQTLGAHVPVVLHGVSLGLASSAPVDGKRLDAFARVVELARPVFWSEHLAFVRGGGIEIGHLAAPPRCAATIEGTARNVARARRVVGSAPLLENVATLIDPPGSDRGEAQFVVDTLDATGCDLLLDLHNLHANAKNFGFGEEEDFLKGPNAEGEGRSSGGGAEHRGARRVRTGSDSRRPPEPCSRRRVSLLEVVAAMAPHPLTVILERDGAFPPFEEILQELARARTSLAAGRASTGGRRVSPAFEAYLARIYTDEAERALFLAAPRGRAVTAGLTPPEVEALAAIDRDGLALAAKSFEKKRNEHRTRSHKNR